MDRYQIIGEFAPAWRSAFLVNWRKLPRVGCVPLPGRRESEWLAAVEGRARVFADAAARAVPGEDELRHAATWVATADLHAVHGYRRGPTASWARVDDAQGDHLQSLLDLLRDPLDLAAVQLWLRPEERTRQRLVRRIAGRGLAEARLRAICAAANGGRADWRELPLADLGRLLRIVLSVR